MRLPNAIVWDLDGVLIDSEPLYISVERDMVTEYKGESTDTTALIGQVLGRSGFESARIIVDSMRLPVSPQEFLERRDKLLETKFRSVELCPGALSTVRKFKELGLKCAIATSSCAKLLEVKREAQPELFNAMESVVCADDVTEAKPAPLIFLEAARRMGVDPTECVVFEDAPAGVEAAKRARMGCIALRNPSVPSEDYKKRGDESLVVIESGSLLDFKLSSIGLFEPR